MLCLVLLSVSVAFAADDVTDDVMAIDDEIVVDEDVLAVEEEEVALSNDDYVIVGASSTVTNDTFFDYFETNGTLKSDVTSDELVFEGEFTNISGVNSIIIDKPIKLSGNNAVLNDIAIVVSSSNVDIDSFTINTNSATNAIAVGNGENIRISNNIINFIGVADDNTACGIDIDSVKNLNIIANVVTFVGKGNGTGNKVLNLNDCEDVVIDGNNFNVTAPSSGYMVGVVNLGGSNIEFTDNVVDIVGVPTDYTINGVCFTGENVTLDSNNISCSGNTYTYGIGAYGSNSKVINNKIVVSSDIYYACGIDLEGYGLTVVDGNDFVVSSVGSVYGIYSGMTSGGLSGNYTNNNIDVSSYFAVGVELGSTDENVVGNVITASGNYTVGVAAIPSIAYVPPTWEASPIPITNRLVKDNTINAKGSNVGNQSTGDSYLPAVSTGAYAAIGNITIKDNKITTTGDYSAVLLGTNSSVTDNILNAKKLYGDKSVNGSANATVKNNYPVTSKLVFTKSKTVLLTAIKSGSYFKIVLKDSNGKVVAGKKVAITFNGNKVTKTTDKNGAINYKLAATSTGSKKLTMKFAGDEKYLAASGTATIKITKEATKLTAKAKTFKAKTKTKKYTVTLKDSKKKAIKKVQVTIKIGKKTFKATTNAKGQATFKITKLTKKAKYTAKVKFAGNKYYKAVTKSVKITVKK